MAQFFHATARDDVAYPVPVHVRKLLIALLIAALLPMTAVAEESVQPPTESAAAPALPLLMLPAPQTLALIQTRVQKSKLPSTSGFIALQPDGSLLWSDQADSPLIPASTMKLVTAVVALEVLGRDWKPATTVTFDVSSSTLYLVGGGDPMLTSANLRTLAASVAQFLTTNGYSANTLRVDDHMFPAPTRAAGVHPSLEPDEVNPIRALTVDRRNSMNTSTIAGRMFSDALQAQGVEVAYTGRGTAQGVEVGRINGLRLSSILRTMLWYSDNDIAEMVFRLSAIGSGRTATWADARVTAYERLTAMGLDTRQLKLVDGSGLSRNNRLTPTALVDLLRIVRGREASRSLETLLPAAGRDGTVRLRFRTSPSQCVRNTLHAKTGGLHDVVSLAGYTPSSIGEPIPFAIIVNGIGSIGEGNRARRAIDALAASFSGC